MSEDIKAKKGVPSDEEMVTEALDQMAELVTPLYAAFRKQGLGVEESATLATKMTSQNFATAAAMEAPNVGE